MPPFIQTAPPPPLLQQLQQAAAFPAAPIDDGVWPLPPEVAWRSDARRRFAVVDDVIVVATEAGGVGGGVGGRLNEGLVWRRGDGRFDLFPVDEGMEGEEEEDAVTQLVNAVVDQGWTFKSVFVFLFVPYILVFGGYASLMIMRLSFHEVS